MKKFKKLFFVVALFLFSTVSLPVLGSVVKHASATPETSFSYLTIEGFVDEANVDSHYHIIDAKVWNNNNGIITEETTKSATVTVKDPHGKDVTDSTIASDNYFKVDEIGEYSIIYTFEGYSHALTVTAKEGIYSFDFDENSAQIIPSYVNIENYTGKIVLPNPTVLDEEGSEIENAIVEVKVLPPSSAEYLGSDKLVKNSDGFYEFTPSATGKWTVNYIYKSTEGKVLASTTKYFTANNSYNNNYKLIIVNNSTNKPTTAITGVTTTLPTISGKNAVTEESVAISYNITAKRVVYNSSNGSIVSEEDATACISNVNEFTPNKDGDYIITYHAKNFFGTTAEWEFEISGVKDSKDPEVKLVKPYTTAPTGDYDAIYDMPEKAGLNNIILPAIWAEDNVDKTFGENGLTLTRKITKSDNTVIYESSENPNKQLVFNHDSSLTLNENQVAATVKEGVTFGVGTYTVSYIAKDKAGNEATATTFKLVLENGFADDEDPSIEWSESEAIPSTTRVGNEIVFSSPKVSDNISTNVKLVVEYQFNDVIDEEDWVEVKAENSQYSIVVEEADKLFIRATATDAYGNTKSINKEIEIHDTNDTQPTSIVQTEEVAGNVYKQQNEITLRNVEYKDDYSEYVQVGAYVTVESNGEKITKSASNLRKDYVYDSSDNKVGVSVYGAKFWTNYSGEHKVAFVSKDLKNNLTIMFYSFDVAAYADSTEIQFEKLPTSLVGGKLELGEKIDLPTAEINVPNGYKYTYEVLPVEMPSSEKTVLTKDEFKPAVVGVYVFEYVGRVKDELGNLVSEQPEPVKFTVEVVDETKPVIGEVYIEPVVALDYQLTIPNFTASDLSGIDFESSKVTLSSKSYGTKTWQYGDDTSNRVVTLGYNEVYTLTFVAFDNEGNKAELKKEIVVGDTEAPVIKVNEEDKEFVPETMEKGKLTLDLSLITIEDLVDTSLTKEDLVITVTGPKGEVENIHGDSKTKYEFNLEDGGEYTISITVEDAAGNKSLPFTRKVTVNEKVNNGVDKNEVIGTVLIVVSVLVLAGVIVYFIVSKKKHDKYKG